jgi:hypothetical protein
VSSFGLETSSAEVSSFGLETSSAGLSSFGLASESLPSMGLSSEFLSSFSLASESLASLGVSSEVLSSFGLSSESLSSWQEQVLAALGGVESSGALSSAALSSFSEIFSSLELLSSLSSESLLSWEKALLLAGGASEFVSLSSETLSSGAFASESQALWAGLESSFSSWSELWSESSLFSGIGASWGEQPYSERGFFMHVNAEVIFYGGTDPRAKLYIAGQPVQLNPDGTFRYHFKFPDQEFEIPIIAISPDNLEARTAILSFRRATQRHGDVGATAQPAHLTTPMGAK